MVNSRYKTELRSLLQLNHKLYNANIENAISKYRNSIPIDPMGQSADWTKANKKNEEGKAITTTSGGESGKKLS